MGVLRFDFDALQDFRLPFQPKETPVAIVEATIKEEAPPPPPTFSEGELESAKRAEFQRGRTEGLKDGHTQAQSEDIRRNQHIESMLNALTHEIATLQQRHVDLLRTQCADLTQLVLMISRKVAGDAISALPQRGIESMVESCLGVLIHQPKMVLHVHSSIEPHLQNRLSARLQAAGIEGELHLQADDNLQAGEGRLEWRDGMAERNLSALWSKIESMLATVNFAQTVDALAPQPAEPITIETNQATTRQEGENNEQ